MPHGPDLHTVTPRRGAADSGRGAPGSRRRGSPARRRGGDAARNGPAVRRDNRIAVRRDDQATELDRALTAALAVPPPEPITFRELGLAGQLIDALAARGIEMPFAIQARAVPDALAGRDVLGRAETGSGKTLAFGLPMLARLASPARPTHDKAPRGLVLVPTRELAGQVAAVLAPLADALGVSVTTVYGGASIGRQIDRLARGVDVVVATPGRLIDLMERGRLTLGAVEITVLDEADYMADLGFLPSVTRIMDATQAGGQRLLFSATLDRGVGELVRAYLSDPAVHAVAPAAGKAARSSTACSCSPRRTRLRWLRRSPPAGPHAVLRPHQARRGPAGQAVRPDRRRCRRHPRQPEPEPAAAGAGRVLGRAAPGSRRHRRRRPRHPR